MGRRQKTILCSAIAIELSCLAFLFLGNLQEHIPVFLAIYLIAFIAYCLAIPVWLGESGKDGMASFMLIFGFGSAILFRATLLMAQPSLSDDIYRYLWDGRVQAHAINPYLYSPDAEELKSFRDANWEKINHKEIQTIYPPFAQVFFYS